VIVCSCNVLSEAQILETLKGEGGERPRSAGEAYRCLGCAPRCGRCVATVRALAERVHLENCRVGCPACPANREASDPQSAARSYAIAAE
jgi:bacterioferritin-associated ferredoxin